MTPPRFGAPRVRSRKARDWSRYHTATAAAFHNPRGRDVLVVGCNRGDECAAWVDLGVGRVVGLDVMEEIGVQFRADNVAYVRASAEATPFADRSFDIVYSFATLEHVPDVAAALKEMARVCRVGGLVYSFAAPLWNCRSGPHWGDMFNDAPWPHLRLSRAEAHTFNEARRAAGRPSLSAAQLDYCYAPENFNRRWAREYVEAGAALQGVRIVRNEIEEEIAFDVEAAYVEALTDKGYTHSELFGAGHFFVARVGDGAATKAQDWRLSLSDSLARSRWASHLGKSPLGLGALKLAIAVRRGLRG